MKRYVYIIMPLFIIAFYNYKSWLTTDYYFQSTVSPKEITDLSYLKQKPEFLYYSWNTPQRNGSGVINNGYILQTSSWLNESEYGIKMVCVTTKAKKEILGTEGKVNEYVIYLEKEIINLSRLLLKDKEAVKAIESAIRLKKGKFSIDKGTYIVITDTEQYTEVSAQVLHFDFYSDIITISCRAVN